MLARLTHSAVRLLDRFLQHTAAWKDIPAHRAEDVGAKKKRTTI